MATWKKLVLGHATDGSELIPPLPSRLVTDEDLKQFYEAMKISDVPKVEVASNGVKRKSGYLGGLDTQHYGRGKRTREVRSYEEQWTEEEFEKMCQAESPESPKIKEEVTETNSITNASSSTISTSVREPTVVLPVAPTLSSVGNLPVQQVKEITPPAKRGRGRPRRITSDKSPVTVVPPVTSGTVEVDMQLKKGTLSGELISSIPEPITHSSEVTGVSGPLQQSDTVVSPNPTITPNSQADTTPVSAPIQARGHGRKSQSGGDATRRRGKKQVVLSPPITAGSIGPNLKVNEQLEHKLTNLSADESISKSEIVSCSATVHHPSIESGSRSFCSGNDLGVGIALNSQQPVPLSSVTPLPQIAPTDPSVPIQNIGQNQKPQNGSGAPRRRGKKQAMALPIPDVSDSQDMHLTSNRQSSSGSISFDKVTESKILQESCVQESNHVIQDQALHSIGEQDVKSTEGSDDLVKQAVISSSTKKSPGLEIKVQNSDMHDSASDTLSKTAVLENSGNENVRASTLPVTEVTEDQHLEAKTHHSAEALKAVPSAGPPINIFPGSAPTGSFNTAIEPVTAEALPNASSGIVHPSMSGSESIQACPPESMTVKRQGRKTHNRVEPPRRRGKRSASGLASPVVPDSLAGQDPKLSHHFQNSSVESLMGKATTNVAPAQALQILLPSGVAAHDLKRKEKVTNSSQNKQQKGASAGTDGVPVSSDMIPFGRIQNVNDVARVMKEVFSGTCLPKPKAPDSAGSEPFKTKAAVESFNSQSKGDEAGSDISNTKAACLTPDFAVNMHEKQSEGEPSNQNLEDKASSDLPSTGAENVSNNKCSQDKASSDLPITGAKGLTSDLAVNRLEEKQSEEASVIQDLDGKASSEVPIVGAVDALDIQHMEDKADLEHEKQSEVASTVQILEGKASAEMPTTGAVNASNNLGFDDKAGLDMPTLGAACLTSDLAVSRDEKQSDEVSDIQNLEGKATSDMPTTGAADASNFQCLEDKAGSDMSTSGPECLVSDLAVNRHEKQSKEASNIENLNLEGKAIAEMPITGAVDAKNIKCEEDKAGLDIPTTGAASPILDHAVNKYEKQSVEASNIQILEGKGSSDMPTSGVVDMSNNQCVEDKAGMDERTSGTAFLSSYLAVNQREKESEEVSNIQNPKSKASPDVPTAGAVSATNIQCLEDKAGSDTSTTGDTCQNLDLPVNSQEKQSEEASNIQNQGDKVTSGVPTTGAVCLTSVNPINGNVQQSGPPSDSEITLLNETLPNVSDDIKEKEDQIQDCDGSSELYSKSLPVASCDDGSGLLIQAENVGDQPQVTPSCPATCPDSMAVVISSISEPTEINSRNEANCSLLASEMEGPEDVQPQKHSDALELYVDLHKEKMDNEDSMGEQLLSAVDNPINVDPVSQESIIFPTPIINSNNENLAENSPPNVNMSSSSADEVAKVINQSNEDPIDRLVLQQPSGSEALVNDLVDVSQVGLRVEGITSETIMPSSSFGKEENRVLSKTCPISSSETLEGSMEKDVADISEFPEEHTAAEESCRNATEVPSTIPVLLQEPIDSEADMGDQGKSQVGGATEHHETGILAVSVTFEGKNEVETSSDKGPLETFEARDESKGLAAMENQADIIGSCGAAEAANTSEVPCPSAKRQVSEDREAVTSDETDASNGCMAVPETASVDGVPLPCPSAAVGEHEESLSEQLVINLSAKLDTKESEAGVANQDNQGCPPAAAAEDRIEESLSQKDDTKSSSALPETASVDGVPPPCSSAAEGEHVECLFEKLDTEESETGVTPQE